MSAQIVKIPLKDVTIDSNIPYRNFGDYYAFFLGRYLNSLNDVIYKSLFQFDLTTIPPGHIINKAEIVIYIIRNDHPSYPKKYGIYRNRESFEQNTLTYNNQPFTTVVPSATLTINGEVNTYLSTDITSLAREWYQGLYPNFGFKIKALDESIPSLVAFYSSMAKSELYCPKLHVHFEKPIQLSSRLLDSSDELEKITQNSYNVSSTYNISTFFNNTFFVKNIGLAHSCDVFIEISPNTTDWVRDSAILTIVPNEMIKLVPYTLSSYIRLKFKSSQIDNHTKINITYIRQT